MSIIVRKIPTDTTHGLTMTIKRTTYREATIEWTSDVPHVDRWLIIIRNEGRTPRQSTDPLSDSEWMILLTPSDDKSLNKIDQTLVSLEYEAGHRYTVAVYGLREEKIFDEIRRYINVANSTTSFRAGELSIFFIIGPIGLGLNLHLFAASIITRLPISL